MIGDRKQERTKMNFNLEHTAIPSIHVWDKLLKGITFQQFISRIERISKNIQESNLDEVIKIYDIPEDMLSKWKEKEIDLEDSMKSLSYKFKGDVFEIFTEYLIRQQGSQDRIGIVDYKICPLGDDTGVDGYGIGLDGTPTTVQCKYRVWDYVLKHNPEHLNNFRWTSYQKYGVDPRSEGKMLIITTGMEVHYKTLDRHFSGKIRCISNDASYACIKGAQKHTIDDLFSLRTLVDNNQVFWNNFKEKVI